MPGSKKKGSTFKTKGFLRLFFILPVVLGIVLAFVNVGLYFIDANSAAVVTAYIVVYAVVCIVMLLAARPAIMHDMMEFSSNYSQVQRQLLYDLNVPYCLLDDNGVVLWMNRAMQECTGKKKEYKKNIAMIFPEITPKIFPEGDESKELKIRYNERDYRVDIKRLSADTLTEGVNIVENRYDSSLVVFYMFDETDINMYIQKLHDERFVVGMVYIDNYEEALESIDDVRRSLFVGIVDKRVNKYFTPGAAIVRKMEKDKYFVVFRYKYLEKLMEDRFSLLEDIKSVKVGNEMTLTLSMGIGTGGSNYAKNSEVAKAAMDLALGRGGDQAVVKDGDKIYYFGGKSQQMEKNTRVKVRVKAHALRQILDNNDNVLVMGHTLSDVDSFGSALGVYVIAKKLDKKAHIVLGDITSSIRPFVNRFIGNEDYPEDMFVKPEEAASYMTAQTAVIVVDVNIPARTECPELLDKCKNIIVLDHHRRSNITIAGAVLSYVDPYASSASEMVSEMIQYVDDNIKLKSYEADALYAGIYIDTDGFNNKTGPRTFEAAAFLRRNGADVTRVRKMLRNDMVEYRAICEAVSKAEVYKGAFAITIFDGTGVESPTIGGAKAANQLLDISEIKASFVITQYEEKIYISARSIDEVNVQLVMEKLGGGGHMTIAGAQLTECTTSQAVTRIKLTLDKMIEEGEI